MELRYFAWVRERMGRDRETVALPVEVTTVAGLIAWLRSRDDRGERAFASGVVRAAVNGEFAAAAAPVADGDEVAFFPPVTGG